MTRLAPQAGDGDTPMALLSLDQKNTFNTSRRDNILGGLKDGLPELCRLFFTFHSFSSELRSGTGELLGYSHTGVHQGDPLGGTYHNMGFQPMLVKLDERVREVVCRAMPRDREPPCAVFAIHDDTYVAVPLEQANAVARIVDKTFEEDGLQLNPDKCKIVSKEWLQDAAYTLVQDGLVMLGTPVGFGDYEQRKSVELLTKKLESLPTLRTINPHCAIRLLDRCVNQRVQYLSRTSEFEGARYIFRYHFDQKIDEFLADILGEVAPPPLPPTAPGEVPPPLLSAIPCNIEVHRTLPRKLGGPGIMAYGATRAKPVSANLENLPSFSSRAFTLFSARPPTDGYPCRSQSRREACVNSSLPRPTPWLQQPKQLGMRFYASGRMTSTPASLRTRLHIPEQLGS